MNLELFILGGYGYFVWPAFIFTFLSCFALYLKTNKEFKKQEIMFLNKFGKIHSTKIETVNKKKLYPAAQFFKYLKLPQKILC